MLPSPMQNTLRRVLLAERGWPRIVFAGSVAAVGGLGIACAQWASAPMDRYLPAAAAVILAGFAVRLWIGEVPEDDDPDEDLIY